MQGKLTINTNSQLYQFLVDMRLFTLNPATFDPHLPWESLTHYLCEKYQLCFQSNRKDFKKRIANSRRNGTTFALTEHRPVSTCWHE